RQFGIRGPGWKIFAVPRSTLRRGWLAHLGVARHIADLDRCHGSRRSLCRNDLCDGPKAEEQLSGQSFHGAGFSCLGARLSLTYLTAAVSTALPFSESNGMNGLSLKAFRPETMEVATISAPGR